MATINLFPEDELPHDEDVQFERDKESKLEPLPQSDDPGKDTPVGETILPPKEETLGKSDFPALSEEEKQPKLEDDLSVKPPGQI